MDHPINQLTMPFLQERIFNTRGKSSAGRGVHPPIPLVRSAVQVPSHRSPSFAGSPATSSTSPSHPAPGPPPEKPRTADVGMSQEYSPPVPPPGRMVLRLWDLDEAIRDGRVMRTGTGGDLGEAEMHWGGSEHQRVRDLRVAAPATPASVLVFSACLSLPALGSRLSIPWHALAPPV